MPEACHSLTLSVLSLYLLSISITSYPQSLDSPARRSPFLSVSLSLSLSLSLALSFSLFLSLSLSSGPLPPALLSNQWLSNQWRRNRRRDE